MSGFIDRLFGFSGQYSMTLLRLSIALVFIWFGGLKIAGISPVADFVASTIPIQKDAFVPFLGVWEVIIGIGFLIMKSPKVLAVIFLLQMAGTFLVFVTAPSLAFSGNPLALTTEGEFVIKNLVLIFGGLVVINSALARGRKSPTG